MYMELGFTCIKKTYSLRTLLLRYCVKRVSSLGGDWISSGPAPQTWQMLPSSTADRTLPLKSSKTLTLPIFSKGICLYERQVLFMLSWVDRSVLDNSLVHVAWNSVTKSGQHSFSRESKINMTCVQLLNVQLRHFMPWAPTVRIPQGCDGGFTLISVFCICTNGESSGASMFSRKRNALK